MSEIFDLISAFLDSIFFPFFFFGMWVLVCLSLAKKSSWSKLKEKYRALNLGQPLKFHSGAGFLGEVSYGGILQVATSPSSLILKVRFPWRVGHPPLAIPWEFVSKIEISENKLHSDNFFNLGLREKITKKAFYAQHANVTLVESPELRIEIPWNDFLSENVPTNLLPNQPLKRDGEPAGVSEEASTRPI